ncbi:ROK family protein [Nakamurella sp. UYEF19]|uniref:ROK family protein n=1 Tax=Nakamurella sp. UYEF19 TaxID=1756392 RepID=UPI0033982095
MWSTPTPIAGLPYRKVHSYLLTAMVAHCTACRERSVIRSLDAAATCGGPRRQSVSSPPISRGWMRGPRTLRDLPPPRNRSGGCLEVLRRRDCAPGNVRTTGRTLELIMSMVVVAAREIEVDCTWFRTESERHVIIRQGGALCTCGRRGCAEAYAGRRSMRGIVTAMVDAGRETSLLQIRDDEQKETLTSKVWARALDEGDELAGELFDTAIETLGVAVGSVVNLLDLEMVVIGGGLAEKLGSKLADRIAEAAAPWMLQPNPELKFVVSELGDDAGVVGAAALGRALVITA